MPAAARIVASQWGWRYAGRKLPAVSDVSFVIEPGERVLLLGPSGSGKSTLFGGIAGVLGGDDEGYVSGSLTVDGAVPSSVRGRVGLMQQDPESNIVLARVGDDVAFGCENLGVPREEIWPRVAAALDDVGLDVPLDRSTEALSGGQKQRLGLASLLAMSPGALLLDEPTANLDPEGVLDVRSAVLSSVERTGATLLVIEHRVSVWAAVVDRVIVLAAGGGILADGPPAAVFAAQGAALAADGVWVPGLPLDVEASPALKPPVPERAVGETRGPAPENTALRAVNLSTSRDGKMPVSTGLDTVIAAGAANVITGPNGSGKSTLALTLAGLLPELEGQVVASDALRAGLAERPSTWKSRDLLTRIGTVFQEPEHQFVKNTLREELAVGPRALGWSDDAIAAAVDQMLERLGLAALAEASPFTLSGGQKRRLSVGTVLIASPEVLVLDEPTFGQDRNGWEAVVGLMQDQVRAGRTVIAITHDPEVREALGGQHIHLDGPPLPRAASGSEPRRNPPQPGSSVGSATPSPFLRRNSAQTAETGETQTQPRIFPEKWQPLLDRVNPATKILMVLALTIPLFFSLDWVSSATALALELLILVPLAGVGFATVAKRMAPLLILGPLTSISILLYARPSEEIFWHWGLITISQGSVTFAIAVCVRILAITLPIIVLFARVDSTEMADALAQVLHLPTRFVLAALAGTRTMGLFVDDWRQMQLARRARGVGDEGRFRQFFSMAFVLLVFAVRRGSDLATAMEARGFGALGKRTWARESRLHWIDLWALLGAGVLIAAAVWVADATGAWHPIYSSI